MRKDESGVHEYCKHSRNAERGRAGRRMVNKRVRKNVKATLRRDTQHDNV